MNNSADFVTHNITVDLVLVDICVFHFVDVYITSTCIFVPH